MAQRGTPGSDIVRRTVSGPSVTKYDLVAVAIPAAYLLVVGPAVVAGVSVHLALVAASAVAAVVMGYALFVDPPTGRSAAGDTTEEQRPVVGRSDTS